MAGRYAVRRRKQNKFSILLVTAVIAIVVVVIFFKSLELRTVLSRYQQREQELEYLITQEERRSEEIREFEKYTKTKKYIEEVAKDKLGLVYEGEIIFKDED